MNSKNDFPLDVVQCCLLFPTQLLTGTLLPCSVLILSMAKNQSDVENLVKNCLSLMDFEEYLPSPLKLEIQLRLFLRVLEYRK